MEQSPAWEANRFSVSQETPRIILEPESSLPHSQVPTTCPYPEQRTSGPRPSWMVRNMIRLYNEELLAQSRTGGLSSVSCPQLPIQYIRSYTP